jgi:hypothetical protein
MAQFIDSTAVCSDTESYTESYTDSRTDIDDAEEMKDFIDDSALEHNHESNHKRQRKRRRTVIASDSDDDDDAEDDDDDNDAEDVENVENDDSKAQLREGVKQVSEELCDYEAVSLDGIRIEMEIGKITHFKGMIAMLSSVPNSTRIDMVFSERGVMFKSGDHSLVMAQSIWSKEEMFFKYIFINEKKNEDGESDIYGVSVNAADFKVFANRLEKSESTVTISHGIPSGMNLRERNQAGFTILQNTKHRTKQSYLRVEECGQEYINVQYNYQIPVDRKVLSSALSEYSDSSVLYFELKGSRLTIYDFDTIHNLNGSNTIYVENSDEVERKWHCKPFQLKPLSKISNGLCSQVLICLPTDAEVPSILFKLVLSGKSNCSIDYLVIFPDAGDEFE